MCVCVNVCAYSYLRRTYEQVVHYYSFTLNVVFDNWNMSG